MISKGLCDTEDCMMLKIQICVTGINYILQYIKTENKIVTIFHKIAVFLTKLMQEGEHLYFILFIQILLSKIKNCKQSPTNHQVTTLYRAFQ